MVRLTKEERRRQIIEAAARVFAEKGMLGTRTREIAEAAGVNEALLYKHFESKEELFAEAIRLLHRHLKKSWKMITSAADNGCRALTDSFIIQTLPVLESPEQSANLIHAMTAAMCDVRMRELVSEWFGEHHDFMVNLVKMGIKDGSLKQELDPDAVSVAIRGIVLMGAALSALGISPELSVESTIKAYDMLIGCISAGEKPELPTALQP